MWGLVSWGCGDKKGNGRVIYAVRELREWCPWWKPREVKCLSREQLNCVTCCREVNWDEDRESLIALNTTDILGNVDKTCFNGVLGWEADWGKFQREWEENKWKLKRILYALKGAENQAVRRSREVMWERGEGVIPGVGKRVWVERFELDRSWDNLFIITGRNVEYMGKDAARLVFWLK